MPLQELRSATSSSCRAVTTSRRAPSILAIAGGNTSRVGWGAWRVTPLHRGNWPAAERQRASGPAGPCGRWFADATSRRGRCPSDAGASSKPLARAFLRPPSPPGRNFPAIAAIRHEKRQLFIGSSMKEQKNDKEVTSQKAKNEVSNLIN